MKRHVTADAHGHVPSRRIRAFSFFVLVSPGSTGISDASDSRRDRVGVSGAIGSHAPCGRPFELSRAAGRHAHARPRPTPKSLDRAGARATPQQLIAVRSVDATAVARMIVKFRAAAAAAATRVAAARPSRSVNLAGRSEGKGR